MDFLLSELEQKAGGLYSLGGVLLAAERSGSQNIYVIAAIRLLQLTGARLSEVLTLQWSFIDGDRGVIVLPDSKTGPKSIPLNSAATALLRQLPRIEGHTYVLPGHRRGEHLVNIQKPWRAIRKHAGLDGVRLHDLRHSFASTAVMLGGSLHVIGKVLGHTQTQTTARYAHVGHDPAAQLSETTGARIAEAMMREAAAVETNESGTSD